MPSWHRCQLGSALRCQLLKPPRQHLPEPHQLLALRGTPYTCPWDRIRRLRELVSSCFHTTALLLTFNNSRFQVSSESSLAPNTWLVNQGCWRRRPLTTTCRRHRPRLQVGCKGASSGYRAQHATEHHRGRAVAPRLFLLLPHLCRVAVRPCTVRPSDEQEGTVRLLRPCLHFTLVERLAPGTTSCAAAVR